MIRQIDGFDQYVKDFYPFAATRLKIKAQPPLTKVLLVTDPREKEDWEDLHKFIETMGPPEGLGWSGAKEVHCLMPLSRDERLKLSQTKPEAIPDAIVDYDAFICMSASKMYADAGQAAAELKAGLARDDLYAVELYHAMSSACIQLLGMLGYGLAGVGTVVGIDKQALPLMNEFRRRIPIEVFGEKYAPS